ncbi:hypothetical protein [Mesorhizobium sp. STM 4661]|uniref:hypothetical protein n=1 Tax=Mesorhizobium sp. STM 4661 TaxID=1297570 RepID=UPI0002BE18BA|nr:hypothetical protein [Mesorhizobium sp. STM 4661]CCV12882.1 conserved hypothetical protein [Mesorhizobium sp. STM 4661]
MQQNLKVQDNIVGELLAIEAKLSPLEARKEELKEALRGFGATSYTIGGIGTVAVSQPSVSMKTGTKLTVDSAVVPLLSPATLAEVFSKKLLVTEDIMSRAAKSRVEIKLVA